VTDVGGPLVGQTLLKCLDYVRKEIIDVWNIRDDQKVCGTPPILLVETDRLLCSISVLMKSNSVNSSRSPFSQIS
jgi:hypothetical protein